MTVLKPGVVLAILAAACRRQPESAAAGTADGSDSGSGDGTGMDVALADSPTDPNSDDGVAKDAGKDAGKDTAKDGPSLPVLGSCLGWPASSDPIPAGFPPGTQRLPALPGYVSVFATAAPGDPLQWKACGVGCTELLPTWPADTSGPVDFTTRGGRVGKQPWLALRRRLSNDQILTTIGPVDGLAAGAWVEWEVTGSKDEGASNPLVVSTRGVMSAVYYHDKETYVFGAVPGKPLSCIYASGAPTYDPHEAWFAATRWAVGAVPAPIFAGKWPWDGAASSFLVLKAPAGDQIEYPTNAGDRIIFFGYLSMHWRQWVWDEPTGVQLLLPATDGVTAGDCCAVSDDDVLVWLRGKNRKGDTIEWERIDLMVAPAPASGPLPIDGKAVRQVPVLHLSMPQGFVADGYWAHYAQEAADGGVIGYVYIVRLTDGRLWKVMPRGDGRYWKKIMYVSSKEIGILEAKIGLYAPVTVVRYDLSSLGPGEPADGGP